MFANKKGLISMNRRITILIAATLCLLPVGAGAADPPPTGKEIEAEIEQLASPNKAPPSGPTGVGVVDQSDYPPGYDFSAQDHVDGAWQWLSDQGPRAFPYLLAHMDDKRYCLTADSGDSDVNWSVGKACHDIFRCNLQPYGDFFTADHRIESRNRPSYMKKFNLADHEAAKKWWEARKEKSLRELQIEALEWTIAEEAKTPEKFTDKERTYLHDLLANLRTADKPLDATTPWCK